MDVLRTLLLGLLIAVPWNASSQGKKPEATPTVSVKPAVLAAGEVAKVVGFFNRDTSGRYMISQAGCSSTPSSNWPGYEAIPDGLLKKCRYSVTSCTNLPTTDKQKCVKHRQVAGRKTATVVLLEPGFDRMARWVVQACNEVGGNREVCLEKVYGVGHDAGNWQIPIAGIVFEDMGPAYVHYGYVFRDGVTVKADAQCGWINGSPEGERSPTAEEDAACGRPEALPLSASTNIRPLSTTRADLLAWRPDLSANTPVGEATPTGGWRFVGGEADAWRRIARDYLVAAASSDRNPLVVAKAFSLRQSGAF